MKEPDIFIYTIVDDKNLHGENSIDSSKKDNRSTLDSIGFQCVSPHGYGRVEAHHETLHEVLNEKLNEKK